MATVYFAKDLRHFRDVAVKIFRRDGLDSDEGSERFLQEIKIAARLSHPNILPLHDSGDDHGLLYYVMPYVPGESLRQRLDREGALPLSDALTIATDIANALAYAHSHGVIHRDIKPENILFIAGNAVVADFGIARAISAGGWDEWKLAGPAGTPAYMSPEQGRGGSRVDGRSDLYSLGCVLYEMLTGEPPFRGSTPEELVVQHLEAEPLPVHARRPSLPRDVQLAVGRALAKHPADRYQTAQQMADALTRLRNSTSGEVEVRRTEATPATAGGATGMASWLRRWGGPSFVAAGLVAAVFWTTGAVKNSRLNDDLLLIGTFAHRAGVPAELDGDQCSRLIAQAIARWEDVRSTDSRWTGDQLARLGHEAALEDLLSVARDGGAGRMLSGEVWATPGDSVKVRGAVYDVRHGARVVREYTVTIAPGLADLDARFSELADSLVLPRAQSRAAASGILGTRNVAAWQAYDSGHAALERWDLSSAKGYFTNAIATDPTFELAYLWRAQTRSWRGERIAVWRDDALRGLDHPMRLTEPEREWGRALLALGEARFPDACDLFNAMLRRDSLDFRAWYGRGDCRARDPVVIRDPRSRTGFAFRGSYAAAIRDYTRALTLVPSSYQAFRGAAFERLKGVLFAEEVRLRGGHALEDDSLKFVALPELDDDTLAFYPVPELAIATDSTSRPASHPAAVRRNLETLNRITTTWAREFPRSVDALRAQALSWELMGLVDSTQGANSAWGAIRTARQLSRDSVEQVDLAVIQFRLLFKAQHFERARQLADSLFATNPTDPTQYSDLVGMAVLLGRPTAAGRLARIETTTFYTWLGQPVRVAVPLRQSGLRLLAFAAIGQPRDSIRRLLDTVQQQIRSFGLPAERSTLRSALVDHATLLLDRPWEEPLFQPEAEPDTWTIKWIRAERANDTATMHAIDRRSDRFIQNNSPWTAAPELVLQGMSWDLSQGDTLGTTRWLDRMLLATQGMGNYFTNQVSQAGALVKMMLLRMDLAEAAGDLPTARRWARSALALWSGAEPGVQPLLADARRLAK